VVLTTDEGHHEQVRRSQCEVNSPARRTFTFKPQACSLVRRCLAGSGPVPCHLARGRVVDPSFHRYVFTLPCF